MTLGDDLLDLCQSARGEVFLAAPFIKVGVLRKLLSSISPGTTVRCVTRWRPEEVVAGVSDLEVWLLLQDRGQDTLYLRSDLHAKYYRADDACLVGSANLTATALGWARHPNLELLVPLRAGDDALAGFEESLIAGSVPVTDDLYEHIRAVTEHLREHLPSPNLFPPTEADPIVQDEEAAPPTPSDAWIPWLRHPEDLYVFYSGGYDDLTTSARESARHDLDALPVAPGLPRNVFEAAVGALLLQMPIPSQVDRFVRNPRRFGEVRDLLARLPCAEAVAFDPSFAWQTLMRWLLHFLPQRYEYKRPRHSEIFERRAPYGDRGQGS